MVKTQLIMLAGLLVFSGVFSGIETALMSVSRIKVTSLVQAKRSGAVALQRIKSNPHKLLITILIGNNIVNIGAASIATVVFTELFGSSGVGIATGVMTFLILLFGEITPKTFASQNAVKISLLVARPVEILSMLLSPFVWCFEKISRLMNRLLGGKEEKLSEDELRTIVSLGRKEGLLSKEAAEMMQNVLDFEGTTVNQIMTAKPEVVMLDGEKKLKQVLNFVVKSPYSRFPVYIDDDDNIVGILDVDDVLKYVKEKKFNIKIKKIVRSVSFVPETKEVDDLLVEFEGREIPVAMVVDEYGEVEGLVTVEDILEEIVGDIFDKSRRGRKYIKKISNGVVRVDARAPIKAINTRFHLRIKRYNYDTLAGFIIHKLQRIPHKGEQIKLRNVILEVDQVTKQGIRYVKIIQN